MAFEPPYFGGERILRVQDGCGVDVCYTHLLPGQNWEVQTKIAANFSLNYVVVKLQLKYRAISLNKKLKTS